MSPSSITDYKQGRREGPEFKRVRIARKLGYDYQDFLSLGLWLREGKNGDAWHEERDRQQAEAPPPHECLAKLPFAQKFKTIRDIHIHALGIPEAESEKFLIKHMGLPPEVIDTLPADKHERFIRIWEYACKEYKKLNIAVWPDDRDERLNIYLAEEIGDTELYLTAIDWLGRL